MNFATRRLPSRRNWRSHGDQPLVPRPDLRSLDSNDWDERVADLQYRDAFEFAVGHSVATEAVTNDLNQCSIVRTCWIPEAEVERVAPADIKGRHCRWMPWANSLTARTQRPSSGLCRAIPRLDCKQQSVSLPCSTKSPETAEGAAQPRRGCRQSDRARNRAPLPIHRSWKRSGSPTGQWPWQPDAAWG